jgi:hypothetical protein
MRRTIAWIAVGLAIVAGVVWFMFRTKVVDAGDKGLLRARYKWGALRLLEYDVNRDGVVDGKDWLAKGAAFDLPETWKPTASMRDVDFDGNPDIEWEVHSRAGVTGKLYWIDRNGDGQLDTVLSGDEGRDYLSRLLSERDTQVMNRSE